MFDRNNPNGISLIISTLSKPVWFIIFSNATRNDTNNLFLRVRVQSIPLIAVTNEGLLPVCHVSKRN